MIQGEVMLCFPAILLWTSASFTLAQRCTNAWIMLASLRKKLVFDLLKAIKSGVWNRHRLQGGVMSVFPASLVWLENEKEKRKIVGHFLSLTLNTKTGGSSHPAGVRVVLGKVTISLLEDIWIQLLCALGSISAFFTMDPGYPRCRDQLSRKHPVGADVPPSVSSDGWWLQVLMVPGQVWQNLLPTATAQLLWCVCWVPVLISRPLLLLSNFFVNPPSAPVSRMGILNGRRKENKTPLPPIPERPYCRWHFFFFLSLSLPFPFFPQNMFHSQFVKTSVSCGSLPSVAFHL